MQSKEQRLMGCKETAQYLGITVSALRKNIYLRRFDDTLVRLGGRLLFDKQKLDALINNLSIKRDGK